MITPEEFACRTNETQINGLEPETSTIDMAHYIGTVEGQPGGASMIISKDSVPSGQVSKAAGKGKFAIKQTIPWMQKTPQRKCKSSVEVSSSLLVRLRGWRVMTDSFP